jgi:hypothetical protein
MGLNHSPHPPTTKTLYHVLRYPHRKLQELVKTAEIDGPCRHYRVVTAAWIALQ